MSRAVTPTYNIDIIGLLAEEAEQYVFGPNWFNEYYFFWVQKDEVIFVPIAKEIPIKVGDRLTLKPCCDVSVDEDLGGIRFFCFC